MLSKIRKNLSNIIGWSTTRKLVILESDDWGSIRTRSKVDYDALLLKKILLKIINESKKIDFDNFLNQFDLNIFSDDIRSAAIELLERAYNNKIS